MVNLHKSFSIILAISAVISFLLVSARLEASKKAFEIARPFERPDYVPAASDVTIRSLNFRPMDKNDSYDTLEAMQNFHATRLEWVYLRFNDKEEQLIRKVKDLGRVFGTTGQCATGVVVEMAAGREYVANSMVQLDGEPLFLEHSRHWTVPIYPGCVNNPTYKKVNLEYYNRNIDYGAQTIQRDDPSSQYSFAAAGMGCFCEHCMEKFSRYLDENFTDNELKNKGIDALESFDFKQWLFDNGYVKDNKMTDNPLKQPFIDFQLQALVNFYKDIRSAVNVHAKTRVPFSCNNTSYQRWEQPYYHEFDFAISELIVNTANPVHIYERSQAARSFGKVQVFGTPKSQGKDFDEDFMTALKRRVVAATYASGALSRVPWDIFQQTRDGRGRYFGKPENYADLYAFVRANDRYLSGYQDAGAFGPGLEENPYGAEKPVLIESEEKDIYAFIRAVPGDKQAPVVIHLVDWNQQNKPFKLVLNNKNFFDSDRLSVSMAVPVEYVKSEHDRAEKAALAMLEENEKLSGRQSSAFASFSKTVKLEISKDNSKTAVNVPAINPWAILIIDTE
ncbi:hypothetical protein SMSP2_01494 [Limihaloglobus sulfuriphilus]|uniref:Uncharacterized protein n=1 Tax=Limihaloglobus sulfuriphilus TaxID=1851148 RepID=A0A1Q2MEP8_9BACT|nr:hypothetical protein [Limihaloglobus sulfuriphilus]AQQ71129.1 hypothetical protein SMSP2_01494 [Limihaloglobus sulfuriphilus]